MSDHQTARVHAVVSGRVQGVGFRMHTVDEAERLGLEGWVQNQWDRTVEVVAEGPREVLEQFLRWLHEGPPLARVKNVTVEWSDARGDLPPFTVR